MKVAPNHTTCSSSARSSTGSSGEIIEYAIAMMATANVFKKGHSIELIVRNQD